MLKGVIAFSVLLLVFGAGYLIDRGWNQTDRYIEHFFYVYSGAMPAKGIDKICIANRNSPNYPKQSLADIVGEEEMKRSFASCEGDLDRCCTYFPETNSVLVIKRSNSLSCSYSHLEFGSTAPATLCFGPGELKGILPQIDALQEKYFQTNQR